MKVQRKVYAKLAVVATTFGLIACVQAKEVVLATWGGTWGKAIAEQAIAPFEKETGIKVRVVSGVSLVNIQMIAAQRANPTIDLVMATSHDAREAFDNGLLAPLDPARISVLSTLPASGTPRDPGGDIMFAGMWIYPYGIAYRSDKVRQPIECWSDLWRPDLANKVGVSSMKYMNSYFPLMINKLAGGSDSDITPGLNRIEQMGRNLVAVADDSASQQRLLAQGEIWAVPMVSSAAYKVIDAGVNARFVIPCEGAPAGMDVIAMVKNAPHSDAAQRFVDYFLSPAIIANVTRELKITPVNRNAKLTTEHARYTVSDEAFSKLIQFDDRVASEKRAAWQDLWDKQIAPMTAR